MSAVAFDPVALKRRDFPVLTHRYTATDTMLYALALGMGEDPLDAHALPFVYEGSPGGLRALPTQAAVLGYPGFWARQSDSGIDWVRMVHGEQRMQVFKPLAAAATVRATNRVTHVTDKGEGKGAVVVVQRSLESEAGELLAQLQQVLFCRGNGGYSRDGLPSDAALAALPDTPDGAPQACDEQRIRPDTALLYRLLGDDNPLHADPRVAAAAGFARPILHGLATYGLAARAVVRHACGHDPARLRSLDVRFCGPVYPGETLRTELWRVGEQVHFCARVVERDQLVLSNGLAQIG